MPIGALMRLAPIVGFALALASPGLAQAHSIMGLGVLATMVRFD